VDPRRQSPAPSPFARPDSPLRPREPTRRRKPYSAALAADLTTARSTMPTPRSEVSSRGCGPAARSRTRWSSSRPITASRWASTGSGRTACSPTTRHCACRS
jgi:hypothetical protein